MKPITKKIINFAIMGVLLLAVLAGNIVCGFLYQMITEFFHGTGVTFEGEGLQETLNAGNELCSEIEGEGIVMLKNQTGKAPLEDVTKVNVFGWASSDGGWTISGYGSGANRIPEDKQIMFFEAMDESEIEYNTELVDLYKNFRSSRTGLTSLNINDKFFTLHEPEASVYDGAGAGGKTVMENAVAYSDTAIVVISRLSGEGIDVPRYQYRDNQGTYPNGLITDNSRSYLELSVEEEGMLEKVKANFENVIVLLNTTNSMEAGFLDDEKIDAAYWVGAPGQSGTRAIPKVLKGEINPSARTTATWAYDHTTDAAYANSAKWGASGTTITYVESVYVGYKWYETADATGFWDSNFAKNKWGIDEGYKDVVQYPFGYGLSYTEEFEWAFATEDGSVAITPAAGGSFNKTDTIKVSVSVTNRGTKAGKDVVQLYYKPPYKENGIEKSVINLAAFAKTVELQPGQTQFLTLDFSPYVMASYDAYDKNHNRYAGYELDKGDYTICIGRNVHDIVDSFTYTLDTSIKYREDPVTGTKVSNQFTGSTAYAGVSLDATAANPTLTYLTRNDFEGTFPATRFATVNQSGNYISNAYDTTETFKTEQENGLYLYTKEDGSKLSLSELNNPQGVVQNKELMMELGSNYDSEKWDLLLDQMSVEEMTKLLVLGGYHTEAIESIGKIWLRENDGPMGLTRSNASTNEVTNWTWYPMVGVLAASWNARLAYRFGSVVSAEANYTGVHGWYAPGFNIVRSPYGGRNNEYYSEDPVFSGLFGSQTVRAALNNGVSCYVKHFVANETETTRGSLRTWLTEQALREIYLKPFEYAVKDGKANGVMTSFNRLGSATTIYNYALNTTILRDEWGFKGGVITDWMGNANTGSGGVRAGNDLWLNGAGAFVHNFNLNDTTTLACMRRSCKNVLYQLCNTYYLQQTHDPADDEFIVNVGVLDVDRPFPYWIFLLIGVDVIVLAACGVWTYFVLKKKTV